MMGVEKYKEGFSVAVHDSVLEAPLKWKQPRLAFVNSMSDLFHQSVSTEFIEQVFDVMNRASQHKFQVLTKRPNRALHLNNSVLWTQNIWLGVSVESDRWSGRIDLLRQTNATLKFLSLEPLLGPLPNICLDGIDWVIVGGESGPKARPMETDWVRDIRDNCARKEVPFFFKQWGGVFKKKAGRSLDDREWNEMPRIMNKNR